MRLTFSSQWLSALSLLFASLFVDATRADPLEDAVIKARAADKAEQLKFITAENERRAKQIEKLENRLGEIKKWTSGQFELSERGVIDKPKLLTPFLKQRQKNRERDLFEFLQFADKNGGAIESGRALNVLLSEVGPAAYQHCLARQITPQNALPLSEATAFTKVDQELLRKLAWQNKALGRKIVGRFNGSPLDVEWPSILKEQNWAAYTTAIENACKQLLIELGSNSGLQPKTSLQLREAVAALNKAFNQYRPDQIKRLAAGAGVPAQELHRLHDADRHIKNLVATVYQIVEATSYQDIMPAEKFEGGNIEDLVAYMQRNNLEFPTPTKATDRTAYYRVFNMLVSYYLDIKAITNLEENLDYEIDKLKSANREASDVALGKTLSASERNAAHITELKFLTDLLK